MGRGKGGVETLRKPSVEGRIKESIWVKSLRIVLPLKVACLSG